MSELGYDRRRDPPAPMLRVQIEAPAGGTVVVPGLIDTGADVTVIPASLARQLRLPRVGRLAFSGVDGRVLGAHVYSARLRFASVSRWCRLAAMGTELIVGRDVLNQGTLQLEGPKLRGSFSLK
jgi:predicted aspartyl protease